MVSVPNRSDNGPLPAGSLQVWLIWAAALASAGAPAVTWAEPHAAEEATVKAAFVYNFGKFTEWPADVLAKAGKLRLCVAGPHNRLAQAVAALETKPAVQGKEIEIRQLGRPSEAMACHLLVITERDRVASEWLHGTEAAPVLTVGDAEGFAEGGGVIGLYMEGENVRFAINQDAAQRSNLRLSSQLLKLARIVKDSPHRETP